MKLSINKWAEEDRPREKMERLGASALSDAELLAILIGSGNTEESAVDLTRRIMSDCNNNLNTLGKMSLRELETYNGIGSAKAITILAACELGKRRSISEMENRLDFSTPQDIYNFMHPKMQDLNIEEGWGLFLNQNYKLIKAERLSHGSINATLVDIRLLIKEATLCNATILAICHNHPSSNPKPSIEDDKLTARVKKACDIMGIFMLDHIIVCDGCYYSYREKGKI